MKFAVFALLFSSASAVRLSQHQPSHFVARYIKTRQGPELTAEDEEEIEAWVTHELTTGDKTITKKEAGDAIAAFAKKKGWKIPKEAWEALEAAFDAADTNGDGELDVNEVMAACEGMEELKLPMQALKSYLKTRDGPPELDSEDEKEIEAWVTHELTTGEKTITKDEAAKAISAFAKKKGYKISKEEWEALEAAFDSVDTNGDGELDLDEVMAAVEAHSDLKMPVQAFKRYIKSREGPELTAEDEKEIEDWVTEELTTGDKTITKKEAHDAIAAFAKKKGWKISKEDWKALEAAFDSVDTNGDGELDLNEVMAAVEAHSEIKKPKAPKPAKEIKRFIKAMDGPELTAEDEKEIEDWVTEELTTGDKTITKKEAHDAIAAFAKKKGWKISKKDWKALEAAFDSVDTNGDGELDLDEVMAAVEAHSEIKKPKKGPKPEEELKKPKKAPKPAEELKRFIKAMDGPELTAEDEKEIEDWVTHELTTGDKTITKDEAGKAIAAFAKKKGWKISKEEWEALEAAFDSVDTNGDGELDLDEVMAAVDAHSELKKLIKNKRVAKNLVKLMRK